MAASTGRMRLIVEVLPLLAENAHGPHQAAAMAAFKGRKFALPVQTDHTFEQVWRQIEERYKRNYLSPAQATCFTIKKLQDAYDCDLDLGDTVGAIFEGESDNQMRMIKVVPSFINRDFSLPVTSNLRPMSASKRLRETTEERASKRRRLEEEQREIMDLDPARDRPLASTESDHSNAEEMERTNMHGQTRRSRSRRSNTGSLVFVSGFQTGNQEFGRQVKEESPELGMPPPPTIPESHGHHFKKPLLPASRLSTAVRQQTSSPASVSRRSSTEPRPQGLSQEARIEQGAADHADVENGDAQIGLDNPSSPQEDLEEAAIVQSPNSTPEQSQTIVSQSASRRQRAYGTPGSPPFMKPQKKPSATYGRSPNNLNSMERDVSLLNSSRPLSTGPQMKANERNGTERRSSNAPAFRLVEPDEIESTPQADIAAASMYSARVENMSISMGSTGDMANGTPALGESPEPGPKKMGSLIKPKQKAYNMSRTPTSSGLTEPTQTGSNPLLAKAHVVHKRTPVPLPENVRHLNKANTSQTSSLEYPARKSQVPLSNNVKKAKDRSFDTVTAASAVTTAPTPRKRGRPLKNPDAPPKIPRPRGRPRKESILAPPKQSNTDTSGEVNPTPRRGRGRPRKDPGNAADSTDPMTISSQTKAKPVSTKPSPMPAEANGTTEAATILSSSGASRGHSNADNGGTEIGEPIAKLTIPDPSEDPPSEPEIASSLEKKHTGVMARLFPEGHEKARKEQDPTREIFGSPVARRAKRRPDIVGDAETSLDADLNGQTDSADMELQLQNAAAMDYSETSESPEPRAELSKDQDDESAGQKTASKPAPWDSTSWRFGAVGQQNDTTEQAQVDVESRSKSTASSHPEVTTETESESDAEADVEAESKPVSAANSARSSPEVSRQPARYLSHSPTPAKSDSEEESETSRSRSQSRAASPKVAEGVEDGSGESSGGSEDESGSENEEVEMEDADPPSSPPGMPTRPITLVPATQSSQTRGSSQRGLRRDHAAVPSNTPLASTSQLAPRVSSARSTNVKPIPRRTPYSKFGTISEQLNELRSNPRSAQALKKFDPKTQSLTQLRGGKKLPFGEDDDSEEESESESSNDEEGGKGRNGALCSVA